MVIRTYDIRYTTINTASINSRVFGENLFWVRFPVHKILAPFPKMKSIPTHEKLLAVGGKVARMPLFSL